MNDSNFGTTTLYRNGILVLLLVSIALIVHNIFGQNGYLALRRQRKELQTIQQQILQLKQENDQMDKENRALKSDPAAIERLAREQCTWPSPARRYTSYPQKAPANPPPPAGKETSPQPLAGCVNPAPSPRCSIIHGCEAARKRVSWLKGLRRSQTMNMYVAARLITLTVVCAGFAFSLAAAGDLPQVGQKAPAVTLPSQDGSKVSLKDFRGKWVVLYFYPKDNTPGCTIEAHNFQRDLSKYQEKNAVIVGVSVDTTESHQDFCTKQSLTFKLLADTEKKVVAEYGSLSDRGYGLAQHLPD